MWPLDINQRFDPVFIGFLVVWGLLGFWRTRHLSFLLTAGIAVFVFLSTLGLPGRNFYIVYVVLNWLLAIVFIWSIFSSALKLRKKLISN